MNLPTRMKLVLGEIDDSLGRLTTGWSNDEDVGPEQQLYARGEVARAGARRALAEIGVDHVLVTLNARSAVVVALLATARTGRAIAIGHILKHQHRGRASGVTRIATRLEIQGAVVTRKGNAMSVLLLVFGLMVAP